MSKLLTIDEVAEYLGFSRAIVSRMIGSKSLPAINVASIANSKRPSWRIREEDLNRWIEDRSTKPSQE